MEPNVDIAFDCLPLRSVGRVDVPLDASPAYRVRCERLEQAIQAHGVENAYYLYNARCVYHLANSEIDGMLRFEFEGTIRTDSGDRKAVDAALSISLTSETCGGLPSSVEAWFQQMVEKAVLIEFDRFIAAGSLAQTIERVGQVDTQEDVQGFRGMYV